ncbi:MAG: hypothetical protein PHW46_04295, partial [Candidatus Omnitrophica bacterium]|nr:hypothetical protein [Candidatus Omnitrophota bacterium]
MSIVNRGGIVRHEDNLRKLSPTQAVETSDDLMRPVVFISVRTNRTKRICLKVISFFVSFVFFVQQISYSLDIAYLKPASLPVPQSVGAEKIVDQKEGKLEISNFDMLSYKRRQNELMKLLPSPKEQEQSAMYAPHYLKRQQNNREVLIRQKQEAEDLMLYVDQRDKRAKEYQEEVPLKKKKGTGAGGVYYTLEDYKGGSPMQLNVYVYQGGQAGGRLMEIVSYDVTKLNTSVWATDAKEIKPKEGDSFIGSYKQLQQRELLTSDRIIRRTIYAGEKGEERIDYILSDYDAQGAPGELTLYSYEGNVLKETISYNIYGLGLDLAASDWKNLLKAEENRIVRKTVYEGAKGEERIKYILDNYLLDEDSDVNQPNRLSIYDYSKDGDNALDEVRSYYITDTEEEKWFDEGTNEDKLESVTVYDGEKDKEKVRSVFSQYFQKDGAYAAWERKDYTYSGNILAETKTYDISALTEEQRSIIGAGVLEEDTFYVGDKNHERVNYSYGLYDVAGVPQIRTDYSYDGRALQVMTTYDIVGRELKSKDIVQEISYYEGRAGDESVTRVVSYYSDGTVLKETVNVFSENSRGIKYISSTTEKEYSQDGTLVGRKEVTNDLKYTDRYMREREDLNGNIRNQNIKTYYVVEGAENLDTEEDVVYAEYTAAKQPSKEWRTKYSFSDTGERMPVEYQEIYNHSFNQKGNVLRQTVHNYTIDEDGNKVYDNTTTIENKKYDFYGNVELRSETLWSDQSATTLIYKRVVKNEYENLLARRRGNASFTESVRYDSTEESEAHEIDRTKTTTTEFDVRGFAVRQTTDTYVVDSTTGTTVVTEKLVSRKEIYNLNIDARGDAREQRVETYETDATGAVDSLVLTNYQILADREFDSQHNVLKQTIYTYDQKDESTRIVLDVQDVYSSAFHSTGVAGRQVSIIYSDEAKQNLLEVKVVYNSDISSTGNIGKTVIVRYSKIETVNGKAVYSGPIDRETIKNSNFDIRGNALNQEILREYWDEDVSGYKFSEKQTVTNAGYDIHDRVKTSEIRSYDKKNNFKELQVIEYKEYDGFGNALSQMVDTYSSLNADAAELTDHKVINNVYADARAARRGNASLVITTRYSSLSETDETKIDRTETKTDEFDARGNVVRQTTDTYVMDASKTEKLTTEWVTYNTKIDNRGDAYEQEIITYQTDATGERDTLIVVDYQVLTNREFDADHNIINQMIYTYSDEGGTLLDVQEIRSEGFHSSGTALKQTIATYSDLAKTSLIDV